MASDGRVLTVAECAGTISKMLDERAAILSRTTITGVFHQCVRVLNARANKLHQHCMVVGIET